MQNVNMLTTLRNHGNRV